MKVYSRLIMRRLWSITVLAAQVAFLMSPAWTQGINGVHCQGATMCNRALHAKHHCAAMNQAPGAAGPAASGLPARGCPMNCCVARSLPNATGLVSFSFVPPLAVAETEIHFVPVIFISAGFSSHTDRGPPAA